MDMLHFSPFSKSKQTKVIPIVPIEERIVDAEEQQHLEDARQGMSSLLKGTFCQNLCPRKKPIDDDIIKDMFKQAGVELPEGQKDYPEAIYIAAHKLIEFAMAFKN